MKLTRIAPMIIIMLWSAYIFHQELISDYYNWSFYCALVAFLGMWVLGVFLIRSHIKKTNDV